MLTIPINDQLYVVAHVVIAAGLGALIGYEREKADKPAGTRTQALVAGASALVVSAGAVVNELQGLGDPTRAMHAVVTGIGFLGGSVILGSSRGIHGVTTAATVFSTAAVGAVVGLGMPVAAAGSVLTVIAVLRLGYVYDRVRKGRGDRRGRKPQSPYDEHGDEITYEEQ